MKPGAYFWQQVCRLHIGVIKYLVVRVSDIIINVIIIIIIIIIGNL